jgi:hypothetical protein
MVPSAPSAIVQEKHLILKVYISLPCTQVWYFYAKLASLIVFGGNLSGGGDISIDRIL